jgi:hypothetical protein
MMNRFFVSMLARGLGAAAMLLVLALSAEAREARAIFIQPPGTVPEKAVLYSGKDFVEIELPQRSLSPEVNLPNGELVLAVLPERPPQGTPIPTDAPKVKIPEAWKRCILLFFFDPSNPRFPARVLPVNASAADFPKGHTRIYNVSQATVAARFGAVPVKVEPGRTGSVKPPISGEGDYPVAIDCTFPGDTTPTAICRSQWRHEPGARQILFVTPAEGYKVPRVWGVLDHGRDDAATKESGG